MMTCHNHISFHLVFILFIYPVNGVETFIPLGRFGHSSVLVGNKLYFFGGEIKANECLNEVFYLDVSQQFNIESPPFTKNKEMFFKSCWGTFLLSELNSEQTIFLCGGGTTNVTNEGSFTSFVYKLDIKSEQWNMPIITGKVPEI